jgi:hypothetical protein
MTVTIDWADEAMTSVVYTFNGRWSWDEFYDCWAWLKAAMDSSSGSVSVIMDVRETRHVPPDVFNHIRSILKQLHPNFSRAAAFVGVGSYGALYNSLLRQLDPALVEQYQVFFVSTLEEACQVLDDWRRNHE